MKYLQKLRISHISKIIISEFTYWLTKESSSKLVNKLYRDICSFDVYLDYS